MSHVCRLKLPSRRESKNQTAVNATVNATVTPFVVPPLYLPDDPVLSFCRSAGNESIACFSLCSTEPPWSHCSDSAVQSETSARPLRPPKTSGQIPSNASAQRCSDQCRLSVAASNFYEDKTSALTYQTSKRAASTRVTANQYSSFIHINIICG